MLTRLPSDTCDPQLTYSSGKEDRFQREFMSTIGTKASNWGGKRRGGDGASAKGKNDRSAKKILNHISGV